LLLDFYVVSVNLSVLAEFLNHFAIMSDINTETDEYECEEIQGYQFEPRLVESDEEDHSRDDDDATAVAGEEEVRKIVLL
jgi:hypothetical protein